MSASPLGERIARRIRAEGPISVAAFMAMALYDPEGGYYARRAPIGAAGDFITAPEISQIFGELIGVWCALVWESLGRPDPVVLAELGPGRGTLILDLWRAAGAMPGFRAALRPHLVEASPVLRRAQEERLAILHPVWVGGVEDLPAGPLLLVANEFLDALPIRQFERGGTHWAERGVGLDTEGRFAFVRGVESAAADRMVPQTLRRSAPPSTLVETCPAALALAASLGRRFSATPGAALFVDYGYFPSAPGPTLRALCRHRPVSVLAAPGSADLSAHVDFAAFLGSARAGGAGVFGPVPQGRFLSALGAQARLVALCARAAPAQRESLKSGLARLLKPGQMGTLFKAAALTSPAALAPPAFEEGDVLR